MRALTRVVGVGMTLSVLASPASSKVPRWPLAGAGGSSALGGLAGLLPALGALSSEQEGLGGGEVAGGMALGVEEVAAARGAAAGEEGEGKGERRGELRGDLPSDNVYSGPVLGCRDHVPLPQLSYHPAPNRRPAAWDTQDAPGASSVAPGVGGGYCLQGVLR